MLLRVFLWSMVLPAISLAGTIAYTTYGLNYEYCTTCGLTIGAANGNTGYTQADQFVPTVSGQLEQIDVAIGLVTGTSEADLFLLTDNSDTPGSLIETFQVPPGPPYGTPGVHLVASSTLHPLLNAGQKYWLMGTLAVPTDQAIWYTNPDVTTLRAESWVGNPGSIGPYQAQVFDVQVNSVPEPNTTTLIATAAAIFLLKWNALSARTRRRAGTPCASHHQTVALKS